MLEGPLARDVTKLDVACAVVGLPVATVEPVVAWDPPAAAVLATPEVLYPTPPCVWNVSVPETTLDPGLGNTTSSCSIVVHPLPILHTNMLGNESIESCLVASARLCRPGVDD